MFPIAPVADLGGNVNIKQFSAQKVLTIGTRSNSENCTGGFCGEDLDEPIVGLRGVFNQRKTQTGAGRFTF